MNKMTFRIRSEKLIINVIIFNRAFLASKLSINKIITVIGKWDRNKNTIIASDIIFEALSSEVKIEPIYSTTSGLNKKTLRNYISNALILSKNNIIDYIPSFLRDKYSFIDKYTALQTVHCPTNQSTLKKALLRLKYEELFLFMLKIQYLKLRNSKINSGYEEK